jgi:ribosome-associated toxin RatA of RatAB toxin-antitoxin module
MAKADYSTDVDVAADRFYAAVLDYASYPKFVDGMKSAEVLEQKESTTRVRYRLSMMGKEFTYVLDHVAAPESMELRWSLVESDFFSKNTGAWRIESLKDGHAKVSYELDVEFKISIPGFMLKGLVKGSLPGMVRGFEGRAKEI